MTRLTNFAIAPANAKKLYIDSHYADFVTGNLEAVRSAYETWARTYPNDEVPPGNSPSFIHNWATSKRLSRPFVKR